MQQFWALKFPSYLCKHTALLTSRGLDFHIVDRLHEPGGSHEEGRVAHPPAGGNDHSPGAQLRLGSDPRIQNLELYIPDGLIAQGTLFCAPLEALYSIAAAAVRKPRPF